MKVFIKAVTNIIYLFVVILALLYMTNHVLTQNKTNKVLVDTYLSLSNTVEENKRKYENTIMDIVKTVQITDSYIFVGGFNQEESAEFNVKRYEDMLTLKSDLDNLLKNTENFFHERNEYFEGLPDIWPFREGTPIRISSPYGDRYSPFTGKIYFHEGIDIVAPARTEIIATASGTVVEHWLNHPIFGKYLVIQLEDGLCIHYAHLSKSYVVYGEKVKKGEAIGVIGNSGQSTGTHLHYAVSRNGTWLDPAGFLKPINVSLTKKE